MKQAGFNRDVGVAPTVGATPTSRPKPMPHSKDLRKGRYSSVNQVYLITTVTENREQIFSDLYAARQLINVLKTEQHAQTLAFVVMPDHLHWLMALDAQRSLAQVLQSVKTLSAKRIGRPIWQPGITTMPCAGKKTCGPWPDISWQIRCGRDWLQE